MSRFVRASSYRHLFSQPHKERYENVKVSASAFDTDLVAVNDKYLSVNWQASGGGAFAVIPLDRTGKLPDLFPLCRAHTAPVLDTAWSPFDTQIVASAGEDGRVAITQIDDAVFDFAYSSEGADIRDLEPVKGNKMSHGRKAGHVLWSPSAEGVLASASYEVKVWDVNTMQCKAEMEQQPDMVGSMTFDYTGDGLATTCRDRKLRLFDTRNGGAPHTVADSHSGVKGSRVCWMGDLDRIITTGFSKMSDRQIFIWDTRNLTAPVKQITVDTSSGTLMPYFNVGNNVLFFAGKGDGNIRYYEYQNDELFALSEHKSSEPQRGLTFAPPRTMNTGECEIARAYKVANSTIEPISFIVPRKSESFQTDLFPPAPSSQPALSADEFFSGKSAAPLLVNMDTLDAAAPSTPTRRSTAPAASATQKSSAAASPAPARQSTAPEEQTKAAPAPVHPAPSIEAAGGTVPAQGSSSPSPISRSASPPISATSALTSAAPAKPSAQNGESDEVASLKKENSSLKQELKERDTQIRKLELQVEKLTTNARKAREALSD